jgi:signal transduction histidine kinase
VLSTLVLVGDVASADRERVASLLGGGGSANGGLGAAGPASAASRVTMADSLEGGLGLLRSASEFDLIVVEATATTSSPTSPATGPASSPASSAACRDVRNLAPRAAILALVDDDAAGALAVESGADEWIARDELEPRTFGRVVRHAIHTRRALEDARRASFLAEGGRKLLAARDVEGVVAALTEHCVPALADACVVDLIAEGAADAPSARSTSIVPPSDPHAAGASARVAGGAVAKQCMLVPVAIAGAPPVAFMTLLAIERAPRWRDADLQVAQDLAACAAVAIEHARFECARDATLSVLSHELRNPLNVISVAVASLRQGRVPAERHASYFDKLRRAADRMNRLIQDVLDVSRLEARKVDFERSLHPVAALAADAIERARPLAQEKSITLACEVEAGLPPMFVDRERVLQVFAGLLGNAIKFTPGGGTVTLAVLRQGDDIRFDVRDTGVGIRPEHMPHLFDRLYQAQRSDRQGAGLGLAIARRITLAHDGTISADSEPGKGSTFHVTLPSVAPSRALGSLVDETG